VGEEAAHRHGWCGAYDAILNELGLSRPVRRVTGTITLTLGFTGTPADVERAITHGFVGSSSAVIGRGDLGNDDQVPVDGDGRATQELSPPRWTLTRAVHVTTASTAGTGRYRAAALTIGSYRQRRFGRGATHDPT